MTNKKVVVITGASSGIGKALYQKFENAGNVVINLSRSENLNINSIVCDVSKPEQVKEAFAKIENDYKKIDLLINNAGFGLSGITELVSPEKAEEILNTNFLGALYCSQNALKLMGKNSRIVNISSATALFPLPYRTLYCASKAALSSLSQGLRMELAHAKIDVVSICPGDTKTPFTTNRVKNFETTSRYEDRAKSATLKLDSKTEKRMSTEYVANKIYNICNKNKTKPQYIVGNKYKVFYFFQKVLPIKLFNKIIEKLFVS